MSLGGEKFGLTLNHVHAADIAGIPVVGFDSIDATPDVIQQLGLNAEPYKPDP